MIASEVREMLSFIDGNPTAYHTTAAVRDILLKAGFAELLESRKWALEPGKDYFVCRNGSSIIAFRMGDQLENTASTLPPPIRILPASASRRTPRSTWGRTTPS